MEMIALTGADLVAKLTDLGDAPMLERLLATGYLASKEYSQDEYSNANIEFMTAVLKAKAAGFEVPETPAPRSFADQGDDIPPLTKEQKYEMRDHFTECLSNSSWYYDFTAATSSLALAGEIEEAHLDELKDLISDFTTDHQDEFNFPFTKEQALEVALILVEERLPETTSPDFFNIINPLQFNTSSIRNLVLYAKAHPETRSALWAYLTDFCGFGQEVIENGGDVFVEEIKENFAVFDNYFCIGDTVGLPKGADEVAKLFTDADWEVEFLPRPISDRIDYMRTNNKFWEEAFTSAIDAEAIHGDPDKAEKTGEDGWRYCLGVLFKGQAGDFLECNWGMTEAELEDAVRDYISDKALAYEA